MSSSGMRMYSPARMNLVNRNCHVNRIPAMDILLAHSEDDEMFLILYLIHS